jgi:hypothetical protein
MHNITILIVFKLQSIFSNISKGLIFAVKLRPFKVAQGVRDSVSKCHMGEVSQNVTWGRVESEIRKPYGAMSLFSKFQVEIIDTFGSTLSSGLTCGQNFSQNFFYFKLLMG